MKTLIFALFFGLYSFPAFSAWTAQELAMGIKINLRANSHTLQSLKQVEELVQQTPLTPLKDMYYSDIKHDFPPPGLESEPPVDFSVDVTPLLRPKGGKAPGIVGLISVAVPLIGGSSAKPLSGEARQNIYQRVQRLVDVYKNPSTESGKKDLIRSYLKDYLDLDVALTNEELFVKDQDLVDLEMQSNVLNKNLKSSITVDMKNLDESLQKTLKEVEKIVVDETRKTVEAASKSVKDDMKNEFTQLESLVKGVADVQNEHFAFSKQRAMEEDYRKKLESLTNYEDIDREISRIQTECNESKSDSCIFQVSQINNLKKLKDYHLRRDSGYAVVSTLKMFQEFSGLIGDSKLSRDLSRAIYVAETGQKIMDLAFKLGTQSALAAVGDVTSMAGMAMSVIGVFGGNQQSADEIILQELQKIREAIQELREEMHQRFDALSAQIQNIGISLDLKTQSIDEKLFVVLDNQEMLQRMISESRLSILDLTDLVTKQQLRDTLKEMLRISYEIKKHNNPDKVHVFMSEVTSTFSSHFEFVDFLNSNWVDSSNAIFALTSEKALQVVGTTATGTPQGNFVNFTLVDYLVRSSFQQSLGGDCSAIDFSQVYLFNALGTALLPSLRANYSNNSSLLLEEKNKYLSYVSAGNLDKEIVISDLKIPLMRVDMMLEMADQCLNNYAKNQEDQSQNVFAYLMSEYDRLLQKELNRVIVNVEQGRPVAELQRAVEDPTQGYLREYEGKFLSLDKDGVEKRRFINVSAIPYFSIDNLEGYVSDKFYENFKTVPSCLSLYEKPPKGSESFTPVELPQGLFNKIFPSTSMKLAILMGLNPMKICYTPLRTFEKSKIESTSIVNIMNLFVYTTLSHPHGMWSGKGNGIDSSVTIPLFVSQNRLPLEATTVTKYISYFEEPNNSGNTRKIPGEPINIDVQVPALELKENVYMSSVVTALQDTSWACSALVKDTVSSCRPSEVDEKDSYFSKIFNDYALALTRSDFNKNMVENVKAQKAMDVYKTLRSEMTGCLRQMLLGYNRCQFRDFKSAESLQNVLNFKEVHTVMAVMDILVPVLSTFHERVSNDDKKAFILDFEKAMKSPMDMIFEVVFSEGDVVQQLKDKMAQSQKDLASLSSRANRDLFVDTKGILNTDVYESIKFYLELTEEVLEEKQAQ